MTHIWRRGATGWDQPVLESLLIGLTGLMMSAGTVDAQPIGRGYCVGGAGTYSNGFSTGRVLQVGCGGEALIQDRFGIGGEVGLAGGGGDAWATFSMNGTVHFPRSASRIGAMPFISGGYTRMAFFTEPGGTNAFNIGGGLTCWLNRRTGFLVEFRDVIYRALGTDQYWAARIGIAFR